MYVCLCVYKSYEKALKCKKMYETMSEIRIFITRKWHLKLHIFNICTVIYLHICIYVYLHIFFSEKIPINQQLLIVQLNALVCANPHTRWTYTCACSSESGKNQRAHTYKDTTPNKCCGK